MFALARVGGVEDRVTIIGAGNMARGIGTSGASRRMRLRPGYTHAIEEGHRLLRLTPSVPVVGGGCKAPVNSIAR